LAHVFLRYRTNKHFCGEAKNDVVFVLETYKGCPCATKAAKSKSRTGIDRFMISCLGFLL
jgi:hypothetical protein